MVLQTDKHRKWRQRTKRTAHKGVPHQVLEPTGVPRIPRAEWSCAWERWWKDRQQSAQTGRVRHTKTSGLDSLRISWLNDGEEALTASHAPCAARAVT